jgi:hypothetical protein
MAGQMHITLILIRLSILLTLLTLANVNATSPARVIIPTYGEIIYQNNNNTSGMFGNTEVGDEFIHNLNSDMWGSFFTCPDDGYAKNITVYVKARQQSRLRCALYEEYIHTHPPPSTRKYMRFIMSTEEKIIPASFEGWVTLNFTACPPITKDAVYWLCAWSSEYGSIRISTSTGGTGIEWTVYMIGQPHGLGYPRFYEVVPQQRRGPILCSIFCTYDSHTPTVCECPYCGAQFASYGEVLEHIKSTPTEMIHLQTCDSCGRTHYLKEELQQHLYEYHGIGSPPEYYSCIFCNFTADTPEEVYTHINDTHAHTH